MPIFHSLWAGRNLTSEDAFLRIVKLISVMKICKGLVLLWVRLFTKHRCSDSLPTSALKNLPALCFSGVKIKLSSDLSSLLQKT